MTSGIYFLMNCQASYVSMTTESMRHSLFFLSAIADIAYLYESISLSNCCTTLWAIAFIEDILILFGRCCRKWKSSVPGRNKHQAIPPQYADSNEGYPLNPNE